MKTAIELYEKIQELEKSCEYQKKTLDGEWDSDYAKAVYKNDYYNDLDRLTMLKRSFKQVLRELIKEV
jgi:hypothetical protein